MMATNRGATIEIHHARKKKSARSELYRKNGPIFSIKDAKLAFKNGDYKLTVRLTRTSRDVAESLREAFIVTQSADPRRKATRPTQIGDIFKIDGTLYVVAPTGFDKI